MLKRKYIPKSTLLELTLRCNMKCSHCGSAAGSRRKEELTTQQWFDVIDQLAGLKCKLITILGGEPLLRKDWYEIAKRCREKGMNVTIISNAYLINDEVISKFEKLNPYTIGISIDGANPETHDKIRGIPGAFEKCMKVLEKLREKNIRSTVVTTVSKSNIKELPALRKLLIGKGIAWQIQLAIPIGRFNKKEMISKEEFYATGIFIATSQQKYSLKDLPIGGAHSMGYCSRKIPNLMLSKWSGCNAGKSVLSIRSDGGVVGCLSLPDEFVEGNVKNDRLEDIWNDPDTFSYNRKFSKDQLEGNCTNCSKGSNCKGGCVSTSLSITGKTNAGPYCLRKIEEEIN